MALGAAGGSLLGFLTAPAAPGGAAVELADPPAVSSSTSRRPRSRFAGASTTRPQPRRIPATAGLAPASTSGTTSTARGAAPTTTLASTSTTLASTTTATSGPGSSSSSTSTSGGPTTTT